MKCWEPGGIFAHWSLGSDLFWLARLVSAESGAQITRPLPSQQRGLLFYLRLQLCREVLEGISLPSRGTLAVHTILDSDNQLCLLSYRSRSLWMIA